MRAAISLVLLAVVVALGCSSTNAFMAPGGFKAGALKSTRTAPRSTRSTTKMMMDPFSATIAAHVFGMGLHTNFNPEHLISSNNLPTTTLVAKTETREGLYGEYTVDVKDQDVDAAASTFKSKEATAKGKNKYSSVLGILLVGSFVIPMAQYWWYIKEEEPDY